MRISQAAIDECEPLFATYLNAMRELVSYRQELFERADNRDLCWQTLRLLSTYQFDRSQAAYCLFVNGLVWDAEIIIRAVYETMAKIVYISSCEGDLRGRLLDEFWTVLPSIYDKKGAQKAEPAKKLALRLGTIDDQRIFEHLQKPEVFDLDPIANRKTRKEIEQRWSFSNIIHTLRTDAKGHRRVLGLEALSHMYGMSSHLAHASPKAIDLMLDRASRGDDLHCLEVSHVCRMMSDVVSLGCFALQFSEFAIEGKWKMSDKVRSQFSLMNDSIEPFRTRFDRSQDNFYSRYGGVPADTFDGSNASS